MIFFGNSFSQTNLSVKIIFEDKSLEGKSISIESFDNNYHEGGKPKNQSLIISNNQIVFRENFSNDVVDLKIFETNNPKNYFNLLVEENMEDIIVSKSSNGDSIFETVKINKTNNNILSNLLTKKRMFYFDTYAEFTDESKKFKSLPRDRKKSLTKEQLTIIKNFDKNTYYSIYFLVFFSGEIDENSELKTEIYNSLSDAVKNTELGMLYKEELKTFEENRNKSDVGNKVPDFEVFDDKKEIFTNTSLNGKVYLIAFSATWCSACKIYEKKLINLYDEYRSEGFEVVYFNQDDNFIKWRNSIKKNNLKWINVSEYKKSSESLIARKFNVKALPEYFLINKKGQVIYNSIELEAINFEIIKKLLLENL